MKEGSNRGITINTSPPNSNQSRIGMVIFRGSRNRARELNLFKTLSSSEGSGPDTMLPPWSCEKIAISRIKEQSLPNDNILPMFIASSPEAMTLITDALWWVQSQRGGEAEFYIHRWIRNRCFFHTSASHVDIVDEFEEACRHGGMGGIESISQLRVVYRAHNLATWKTNPNTATTRDSLSSLQIVHPYGQVRGQKFSIHWCLKEAGVWRFWISSR